ncbi:MAG: hypothetical protein AM326_10080 [Candidatus Thorarchaeota archaeon SMTZ-45]|nr:MAG: hypothetical protein AM325_01805 [Candidatus Thorarchaeota archaeon SMTZ1-45]KXH74183.1 MAG: hypothetical protein AM326_10080 [Candidatus Thorarchaeota archaeon SMTZ-45]
MRMPDDWENRIRETIKGFPSPHRDEILQLWDEWLKQKPESPLYESWAQYSSKMDDQDALYTETRVYLRKIKNELREMEIPLKMWQKVAKTLAAVASVFLVIFLALSRAMRVTE